MDDDVPQPVVAVHERHVVPGGNVLGHPRDQPFHRLDPLRLGGAVLLGPAMDLAREIIPRPPEIGEAERLPADRVQPREDLTERLVDGGALARREAGDRGIGDDTPVDAIHDVERGADDRRVLAERVRARHREPRRAERRDDAVLALHRVRRGQELARRLPAQDVLPAARRQVVGRVRLAAAELLDAERAREAGHVLAHVARERAQVEAMLLADLRGGRDHPGRPPARASIIRPAADRA